MIYHPYGNTDPFKVPEFADNLLNEYWDIAEALKIETCLIYGTCLGFVRGDGWIIGDNDIDVFILGDIFKLTSELVKNGFSCRVTGHEPPNAHFLKYNILFDIFFDHPPFEEFLKSFDEIEYKGRIYNVPHPVEEYLVRAYGDWKTPALREVWNG